MRRQYPQPPRSYGGQSRHRHARHSHRARVDRYQRYDLDYGSHCGTDPSASRRVKDMRTRKRATAPFRIPTPYDCDYWSWTIEQSHALSEARVNDLDLPHLAEEIADSGKSEEHRLERELARLMEHLLKLRHASPSLRQANARGWSIGVSNARWRAGRVIAKNPG